MPWARCPECHREMPPARRKQCRRCERILCVDEFRFKRKDKGHRQSYCKGCASKYHREWYAAHGDARRAQIRTYKATQRAATQAAALAQVAARQATLDTLSVGEILALIQAKLDPAWSVTITADTIEISNAS